jgi:hypothetical protein
VLGLVNSQRASAEEPLSEAVRAEAHERFDRAVRLFGEKNNDAALAELKRVYELAPNSVVLYNLALVYAGMGRPVDAVDAVDRVLAAPGTLSADRLQQARALRAEQAARVGSVAVTVNVDGAAIEVDAVEVAKAPLSKPLSLASGTHILGAIAQGHAPARKEVTVAGGTTGQVTLELVPIAGRLAHLVLKSHVPAASVVVDGVTVGRTPLAASLTLPPGSHHVEVARTGYVTSGQDVVLGEGATGEVVIEPAQDAPALEAHAATLVLSLSQSQSLVFVDGAAQGVYGGSLRLPPGMHHLRVEHGGFITYERDMDLPEGRVTNLPVELIPTSEALAAYTSTARFHRTWGWVGVASGTVLVGGSVIYLIASAGATSSAQSHYNNLVADQAQQLYPCNWQTGKTTPQACQAQVNAAYTNYQNQQDRNYVAYAFTGLGVALLGTGVVLLVTGDDVHRYDRKPGDSLVTALLRMPAPWTVPGGGGLAWGGVF